MRPHELLNVTRSLEHGDAVGVLSLERDRGLLRRAHLEPLGRSQTTSLADGIRCQESVDGEGGSYGGC